MKEISIALFMLSAIFRLCQNQFESACLDTKMFGRDCHLTCECVLPDYCVDGSCIVLPEADGCRPNYDGPICQRHNVAKWSFTNGLQYLLDDDHYGSCNAINNTTDVTLILRNASTWTHLDVMVKATGCQDQNNSCDEGRQDFRVSLGKNNKLCSLKVNAEWTDVSCISKFTHRSVTMSVVANSRVQFEICQIRLYVCKPFTFGMNCEHECFCLNPFEVCNPRTGKCKSGCDAGYTGVSCHEKCSGLTYGFRCAKRCGCRSVTEQCHHLTGECKSKCPDMYGGIDCKIRCEPGFFIVGMLCNGVCHCLDPHDCQHRTGRCQKNGNLTACMAHFNGTTCQDCIPGWFGPKCEGKCNCRNQATCDPISGSCRADCPTWYTGDDCQQRKNVAMILGLSVSVPILVAALLFTGACVYWRKHRKRRTTSGYFGLCDCLKWWVKRKICTCRCFCEQKRADHVRAAHRRMLLGRSIIPSRPRSLSDIRVRHSKSGKSLMVVHDPSRTLVKGESIDTELRYVRGLDPTEESPSRSTITEDDDYNEEEEDDVSMGQIDPELDNISVHKHKEGILIEDDNVDADNVERGDAEKSNFKRSSLNRGSIKRGRCKRGSVRQGSDGKGSVGRDSIGQGSVGRESFRQGSVGRDSSGQESVAGESLEQDGVGQNNVEQDNVEQSNVVSSTPN